jgi:putative ABC transport system permease protein
MRPPTVFGLRPGVPLALYRQRLRQRTAEELLAAVGIAVGVALVFGVLVASTSVTRSAGETIRSVTGDARLQLAARSPAGFDERLVGAVAGLPGVAHSGAVLRENIAIVGPRGRDTVQLLGVTVGVTTIGGSDTSALTSGTLPEAGGLLLPAAVAGVIGARQGSTVTVLAAGAAQRIKVAEVLAGSRFGLLASNPVALAQMPIAQQLTGRAGRVTAVLVQSRPGATRMVAGELEKLAAGRLDVLPSDREIALLDQAVQPNEESTDLFAFISAMVGFLLAFNAMLLTVPERRRSVAELRILGYDAAQVAAILIFQALALGVASSVVGIGLGYVLSRTLFDQVPTYLAFAFPIGGHKSISLTILAAAFACGIVAALLASLPPVLELRRKRALDAVLRERGEAGQRIPPRAIVVLGAAAAALTAIVTLLALATTISTLVYGVVLAGATICAIPAAYKFATWLLGPLAERSRGMLALAVIELESTATRSIALAGVAGLVVYAIVAIGGARADVTGGLERTIAQYESTADVWVSTGDNVFDTDAFRAPGLPAALARLPSVAAVRVYQGGLLDVGGRRLLIRAHDPRTAVMIQPLALLHGSFARANRLLRQGGWATVSEGFAAERDLRVGDRFLLPTPSGELPLRVAATTTNLGWPGGLITLSSADYRRAWLTSAPSALEVGLRPGVSAAAGTRAVRAALRSYPGLQAQSAAEATAEANSMVRQGLSTLAQISTLLLIIGALAIAASLSAAIWQRRGRLASMRIWGYDRTQLWRSVLLESTILLAIGCSVGACFGLYGHAFATRYLRVSAGFPAPFSIEGLQILLTLLLVTGISLVVVALPGMGAAQVSPTAGFQE